MLRVLSCMFNQPSFMAPVCDMSRKTVIVTGPTLGGIGYISALTLAKFGARVILAARNLTTAAEAAAHIREEVPSATVEHVMCDLSRLETVASFADSLRTLAPNGVDVLLCNAAAIFDRNNKTPDGVEMTFAVAVLGHHKMIHLVQPRRLVWVTGDIYVFAKGLPDPFSEQVGHGAYFSVCLARLLLAAEWKKRTAAAGAPMEVVAVHPGVINTELNKATGLLKKIAGSLLLNTELGAQASILAATAPSAQIHQEGPVPYYHNKQGWLEPRGNDPALNPEGGKQLFDKCDELCGVMRN